MLKKLKNQSLLNILIGILFLSSFILGSNQAFSISLGDKAPPILLEGDNGKNFNLRRYVKRSKPEKITAFAFFSVTCKPCVKEMQELQEIYKDTDRSKFQVYLISVDQTKTTPKSKTRSFLGKISVNMPILYDSYRRAGKSYGIIGNNGEARLPALFVIDSKRKIILLSRKYSKKTISDLKKMVISK